VEFNETISFLKTRITSPLPGTKAHRRAIPPDRIDQRLNVEHVINPRLGGVLVLLFPDKEGQAHFALIQRPEYTGTHGGQVSFPGGKIERQDQTLIDTALRETSEEIGVDQELVQVIGTLSDIYIPPSNFKVTPVIGFTEVWPVFQKDPYEVEDILVVPLASLMDKRFYKSMDIRVRDITLPQTPYYHLLEKVVWGATAMILSELLHLLEEKDLPG
jgi:8-oxo-dGTP pyrophosphatase MutT (NUDIX family)